ncbi:hypothetical protein [Fusobacterium varium]|uniref:hypothetical protein n=1 Tax=Fusobacterium varium TaxID=856 RepID=UPI0022E25FAF|nr:hypothetical protein [Fusobacterium varium]
MSTNFDDFLERVKKYEDKKIKVTVIDIENFGEMEVQRPSANEMLKYQKEILSATENMEIDEDNLKNDREDNENTEDKKEKFKLNTANFDYGKVAKASSAFVYNSCSALRQKPIRDIYSKVTFEDIPLNLFGENKIIGIASQIYSAFNGEKEVSDTVEVIKN